MLEKMCSDAGITGQVRFLGWRTDTVRILSVTDVFVMTSLWEGLPRSIVEAMCRGIPVVANAVDGVKEIVKNDQTGYLIKPFAIEEMASKIMHLLDEKTLSHSLGDRGREPLTSEFDINIMVCEQEKLYDALVHNRNTR